MHLPRSALAGALYLATLPVLAGTCTAQSGAERATLIELYTSEGCSSCPPADRWLSGFAQPNSQQQPLVALAFHVDYWDQLGWRDRFASPRYTARQYERVRTNQGRFAYTPQTLINGKDSSAWRQANTPGQLPSAPAVVAAGANLTLTLESAGGSAADGIISAALDASLVGNSSTAPVVAYLALYENKLSSSVSRGENSGKQLAHDFVVREWQGPFPLAASGNTRINHKFQGKGIVMANAGVAVIVERQDGSQVLQALAKALCKPG